MSQNNELKKNVDADIAYCGEILDKYPHDAEKLEELFNIIFAKYKSIIKDFGIGLKVISPYESGAMRAETARANLKKMLMRLEMLKRSGYSTDNLAAYYVKEERYIERRIQVDDFNEARMFVYERKDITSREKEEISDKLDEIEVICCRNITKAAMWEFLRPYMLWLSGKDYITAKLVMHLLLKYDGTL